MDEGYPAIYYQTIRDMGIDPVVCGDIRVSVGAEGCTEEGSARPVQLAEKALAKASGSSVRAPRKRTPRKATAAPAPTNEAPAAEIAVTKAVKRTNARVPSQTTAPAKAARGTAKVASSG